MAAQSEGEGSIRVQGGDLRRSRRLSPEVLELDETPSSRTRDTRSSPFQLCPPSSTDISGVRTKTAERRVPSPECPMPPRMSTRYARDPGAAGRPPRASRPLLPAGRSPGPWSRTRMGTNPSASDPPIGDTPSVAAQRPGTSPQSTLCSWSITRTSRPSARTQSANSPAGVPQTGWKTTSHGTGCRSRNLLAAS